MPRALVVVAVLLLVAGYADLALGGSALAAALLVAGYAVGVPTAILWGGVSGRQRSGLQRLPR